MASLTLTISQRPPLLIPSRWGLSELGGHNVVYSRWALFSQEEVISTSVLQKNRHRDNAFILIRSY